MVPKLIVLLCKIIDFLVVEVKLIVNNQEELIAIRYFTINISFLGKILKLMKLLQVVS